jgi:transposase
MRYTILNDSAGIVRSASHVQQCGFRASLTEEPPPLAKRRKGQQRGTGLAKKSGRAPGIVEVEIGGVTVRVGRGAESKTVTAVIRALKAGS